MTKTYITFGQVHVHHINGKVFDKDCVAVVDLPEDEARAIFMPQFCFSYAEEEFNKLDVSFFPRGLINVELPIKEEQ